MEKYNVMGCEMVKLTDLCYGLRKTRKGIDSLYGRKSETEKAGMRKAVENMARFVFAEEIRNVILDPANTAMDARTEALLYAASRRQHPERKGR